MKTNIRPDLGARSWRDITTRPVSETPWRPVPRHAGASTFAEKSGAWDKVLTGLSAASAATIAWLATHLRHSIRPQSAAALESPATIALRANEIMSLTRRHPATQIVVQHGIVWLTSTPASGDILLQAGDRFDISSAHPYVVQALRDAKIAVHIVNPAFRQDTR